MFGMEKRKNINIEIARKIKIKKQINEEILQLKYDFSSNL